VNPKSTTYEFLESEYERNIKSRQLIFDGFLAEHVRSESVCLDYGCGPGFLALATARRAEKVVACDISRGVLACAEAINPAPNIEYRMVEANGRIPADEGSIDLAYCFAVFQHVTDETMSAILSEFRRVLKPGARVVCHVIIERSSDRNWRSEAEWRADRSLKGRLRWQFGMRCFVRTRASFEALVDKAGLGIVRLVPIAELGVDLAQDDMVRQHLCLIQR